MNVSRNNFALPQVGALMLAALVLTGCQETATKKPSKKMALGNNATQVAEGTGDLKLRVAEDGRVFIYDVEDDAVLGAKRVRAGQVFVLVPDINAATLDGRRVFEQDLKRNHVHRLYFEPE